MLTVRSAILMLSVETDWSMILIEQNVVLCIDTPIYEEKVGFGSVEYNPEWKAE